MKKDKVVIKRLNYLFVLLMLLMLSIGRLEVNAEVNEINIQGTSVKLSEGWKKIFEEDSLIKFQKNEIVLMILISDIKETAPEIKELSDSNKRQFINGFEESLEENNIKIFWKNTLDNQDENFNGTLYNTKIYIDSEEHLSIINMYFDGTKSVGLSIYGPKDKIKELQEMGKDVFELNGFKTNKKLIRSEEDAFKEGDTSSKKSVESEGKYKESDYDYAYVQDFPHGEYEIYYLFNTKDKTVTSFMTDEPTSVSTAKYTGDFNNGVEFELDGLPMSGHFNYWDSPAKFVIYENGFKLDKLDSYSVHILVEMLNRYD